MNLFQALNKQIEENKDCYLISIVEGHGSAPRNAGAHMIVSNQGRIWGTIGGGWLEYEVINTAKERLIQIEQKKQLTKQNFPQNNFLKNYNLNTNNEKPGMICGGQVKILFSYFNHKDKTDKEQIKTGIQVYTEHRKCIMILPYEHTGIRFIEERLLMQMSDITKNLSYTERLFYDGNVYVFGGGHLAQELVQVLAHLDFHCIVADDRKEFADSSLFPHAYQVHLVDFSQLNNTFTIRKEDYLIVATRSHASDIEVERFALNTLASYIGVVGSKKKTLYINGILMAEGFTKEQLQRITTPIGLDIGGETPAEIAISIAAQLIQERADRNIKRI